VRAIGSLLLPWIIIRQIALSERSFVGNTCPHTVKFALVQTDLTKIDHVDQLDSVSLGACCLSRRPMTMILQGLGHSQRKNRAGVLSGGSGGTGLIGTTNRTGGNGGNGAASIGPLLPLSAAAKYFCLVVC
jgi:hypothetical protein